jgi:excinuclease ABC subunit A
MDAALNKSIRVIGARTHNLKNVSVEIPRDQVVVITGPSGSGKSSLAIDTLSAEGQRQYFQCLSIHSRQFFKQLPAADVDQIEGLPPTIFIDQAIGYRSRRSTVGTITEVHDYLRLLIARCGILHCYRCQQPIVQNTPEQIRQWVQTLPERSKIMVLAPLVDALPGDHQDVLKLVRRERLVRVRIDGMTVDIDQVGVLDAASRHSIAAVTDRLAVRAEMDQRLMEAIALADRLADGRVIISYEVCKNPSIASNEWKDQVFSTRYACANCKLTYEEVEPSWFSFNTPHGACPTCHGLGEVTGGSYPRSSESGSDALMEGVRNDLHLNRRNRRQEQSDGSDGPNEAWGKDQAFLFSSSHGAEICEDCQGSRLNLQARSVRLGGLHLGLLASLSIGELAEFLDGLRLPTLQQPVAEPLLLEIQSRLSYLQKAGVDYLSLGRSANSLSGGEYQRVRLATSIGSGLSNVGYILDEPSIGLHPRDNQRLIQTIRSLQQAGNTVILVEHDEETIRNSDFVIDMGPQAGNFGGNVVALGTPVEISSNPSSLTGAYLDGRVRVTEPKKPRPVQVDQMIELFQARGRNLKHVDLKIPLGLFVAVSGVSGSGKSSLINHTLVPALINSIRQRPPQLHPCVPTLPLEKLHGADQIDRVAVVDQWPMAGSARGCTATVVGIFDPIRKIFSTTKKAKQLGFGAGRFTFNSASGSCPDCRGLGSRKVEMNLIPDFFVICETCRGRRFNLQTLQVKFNEHSISDVLDLSVEQGRSFFDAFENIARPLQTLLDVGLGYLKLGQPTSTLSGGESQRLKLASELAIHEFKRTLYVMDEPTTGLHFSDIKILLQALDRLINSGNSLVVIEHNLDVLRHADWIIDVGPEGGEKGGEILGCGPPEFLRQLTRSYTGKFL